MKDFICDKNDLTWWEIKQNKAIRIIQDFTENIVFLFIY